jgi:hypothetical protein
LLQGGRALEDSEAELTRLVDAAKERMRALEAEWAEVRRPLEERLEVHANAARRKRERAAAQLQHIQSMRAEMRELAGAARAREEDQRRLLAEYEAAPKSVNRAAFVKRIMEIIKNVKKQEVEIMKITADTREARSRAHCRAACVCTRMLLCCCSAAGMQAHAWTLRAGGVLTHVAAMAHLPARAGSARAQRCC